MSIVISMNANNNFEYQNSQNVKDCSYIYNKIVDFYVQELVTETIVDLYTKASIEETVITIDPMPTEIEEKCPICFGDFDDQEITILGKCEHVYHKKCMDGWINKNKKETEYTCPLCRECYNKPPGVYVPSRTVSLPENSIADIDSDRPVYEMIIIRISILVFVVSALALLILLANKK